MNHRERQRRRRHQRGHPAGRALLIAAAVLIALAGLGVTGAVGWVVSVANSAPSIDQLKPLNQGANSTVFAADGTRLGFINSLILRAPLPSKGIPQNVKDATVAIEDRRFYKHQGVDYQGVVRAALRNLTSHKTVQGGSTLTMQYVRNVYLPDTKYQKTVKRKIIEAKLAEQLEKERSKKWILDGYLNSVSYGTVGGQTAVGIGAASRMFFDKPASKLTLAQSALLAGLPQAPTSDNPFVNLQGAYDRRNEVLRAMVKAGYITPAQGQVAAAEKLGVQHNRYFTARREQFVFDYVTDELVKRYGVRTVRQGGLKIYTSIQPKLQDAARAAIAGRLNQPGDPSSAVVSIDPRNGHILAMASSAAYGKTKFNYATQGHRQPGSTFKVMVLMTALSKGINPETTSYVSHKLEAGWLPGYPTYSVDTYGHNYLGSINLVRATLQSDNTVYAQLTADVTPESVRETAYKMGITTHLDAYPAEGLGGLKYGVSPLEMANAYATIASGGFRNTPTAVTRVVHPDGKVDDVGRSKRVKAFSDAITSEATKILHENTLAGTGTAAPYGCPVAGKTGTTSDYKDAWFVGFEPQMSTAVWVGYANPPIPMRSVHGIEVAGGTFPAEIWHDFMSTAHGSFCGDFPPPKESFSSSTFFGKYSSTGSRHSKSSGYGSSPYTGSSPGYSSPSAPTSTSPYQDPTRYASPPQSTPKTAPPPSTPPNGNGNGKPNGTPGGGNTGGGGAGPGGGH